MKKGFIPWIVSVIAAVLCLCAASPLPASTKTFPKGSYIIPQDHCWQPNKDPKMKTPPTNCDPNKNDQGIFQATGLVYDLLYAGYPVYWIINPNKTTMMDKDVSITKSGTSPAVKIYHSLKADSDPLTTVDYIGGPFVLDANDVDAGMQAYFSKYANVKLHYANYDFSAEVDKVLSGMPPRVAVQKEGSSDILTDYLFASGLGNTQYDIFSYVTSAQIINGALSDYQLIWFPHWELDSTKNGPPSGTDKTAVIAKVRSFLEAGNAGFFECASIESFERGYSHGGGGTTPDTTSPAVYAGQGFLVDENATDSQGRVETNAYGNNSLPTKTLVFEHPTNVLNQCGGWNYAPTSGRTMNIRPSQLLSSPTLSYAYNSTVQRFIHDNDSTVSSPTSSGTSGYVGTGVPNGYDYFLGGNINGNATQGYVAYLGGHQYVSCTGSLTSTPVKRYLELWFNKGLVSGTTVTVEAVYSGCIAGSTCPVAAFNADSSAGTYASDGTVFVDLDSATYGPDADPAAKYVVSNIAIGNLSTTGQKIITSINVSFDGNPLTTVLNDVVDLSDPLAPVTVCPSAAANPAINATAPLYTLDWGSTVNKLDNPTPSKCPEYTSKLYDFNFSNALTSGATVTVVAVYSGGSVAGSFVIGTAGSGNSGTVAGKFMVDMSKVSYDAVNNILKNVTITNLGSLSQAITGFIATYSPTSATLTSIQDVTLPNSPSTLSCGTMAAGSPSYCPPNTTTFTSRHYQFYFSAAAPKANSTSTLTLEALFSGCNPGATCPKISLTYNGTTYTGWNPVTSNGNVAMDMSGGTYGGSPYTGPLGAGTAASKTINKTAYSGIKNVTLTNLTGSNIDITDFVVTWSDATSHLVKYVYDDNGALTNSLTGASSASQTISSFKSNANLTLPATSSAAASLNISFAGPSAGIKTLTLGQAVSSCAVDYSNANTCGIKFVLNTLIGLQFKLIPHEYAKAGSIQQDNILYKSTFEYPGYKGHLYAIDVKSSPAVVKWDAGKNSVMPNAGTSAGNPSAPSLSASNRYIFTNIPGTATAIPFATGSAGTVITDTLSLWKYLDPSAKQTLNQVKALINSVRGRKNASATNITGTGEVSKRLGGIEHSAPAVMTRSKLVTDPAALTRDKVVFVGGDDGMLHAFFAGHWDTTAKAYTSTGTGREIWAYIPGTLLGSLQNQTFTDCNPGETINACDPASDPTKCVCPVFSVAVSVDGSPAIGDFFVDHDNDPATPKQWRTILVATAKIMTPGSSAVSVNQGIIFSLDVTDPYAPKLLWERTLNSTQSTQSLCSAATFTNGSTCGTGPGSQTEKWAGSYLHYYPSTSFTNFIDYPTNEKTVVDPNMGDAKGVAIGRVQVGATMDTSVFVTSRWVRQVDTRAASSDPPHTVWGMSVYSLDFRTGTVNWLTKIAYTGDAEGVNEAPATPALMDIGNNGTFDYVAVGDMQGRLWVLKTTDGSTFDAGNCPAYTVGYGVGCDTGHVGTGAKEPIGVPVSISGDSIVFGTGGRDSLQDQDNTKYHLFAVEIMSSIHSIKNLWNPPYELNAGEKVWSSPLIDDSGTVYVGTAIGYTDIGQANLTAATSSGRFLMLDLTTGQLKKDGSGNAIAPLALTGAVIGQMTLENNHITMQQFNGTTVQIGADDAGSFATTVNPINPVRVLWWRKL